MSDVSLSSEPSIYYQDIKLTDDDIDEKNKGIEEHEEECTALLVEEKPAAKKDEIIAAPDVVDAVSFSTDFSLMGFSSLILLRHFTDFSLRVGRIF